MTVTAAGKKDAQPPALTKDDVELYQGKEKVQVAIGSAAKRFSSPCLSTIRSKAAVANQWSDLKAFLMAQPENTYIAVAYARNGVAMVAQDFTKDHALAAKALRMPLGNAGAFTSPYLAVQDWVKRWPDSGERKSIMLFSSGIDYFRGELRSRRSRPRYHHLARPEAEHQHLDHLCSGCRRTSAAVRSASSTRNRTSAVFREETGAESYYLGSRHAGYAEAVLRRNPDASQQPIPAQLCGQRREEGQVRARARVLPKLPTWSS